MFRTIHKAAAFVDQKPLARAVLDPDQSAKIIGRF
jgi:hypothetical protein